MLKLLNWSTICIYVVGTVLKDLYTLLHLINTLDAVLVIGALRTAAECVSKVRFIIRMEKLWFPTMFLLPS